MNAQAQTRQAHSTHPNALPPHTFGHSHVLLLRGVRARVPVTIATRNNKLRVVCRDFLRLFEASPCVRTLLRRNGRRREQGLRGEHNGTTSIRVGCGRYDRMRVEKGLTGLPQRTCGCLASFHGRPSAYSTRQAPRSHAHAACILLSYVGGSCCTLPACGMQSQHSTLSWHCIACTPTHFCYRSCSITPHPATCK